MSEVTALGYVVVTASDLEAWSTFGQECLGLEPVAVSDGLDKSERLRFRMDDRAWRLEVQQGEDGALVALGFEVFGPGGLKSLQERLQGAGFPARFAPELSAERNVAEILQTTDPSGVPLEFYYGGVSSKLPFKSPTAARFVTGLQGMGHAVVSADDIDATNAFYLGLLGFRLSDVISLGGLFELTFTSPSPRHHSLAYGVNPLVPGGRIEHIMLEVDDLDVVGRALDYCLDNEVPIRAMLGRHTNDHVVSFYCNSPSGMTIEYGWGGREISDATHVVGRYDAASYWGHRPPDGRNPEEMLREMLEAAQRDNVQPS